MYPKVYSFEFLVKIFLFMFPYIPFLAELVCPKINGWYSQIEIQCSHNFLFLVINIRSIYLSY